MAAANNTSSRISEFELICFPGIQSWQHWLSIPVALLFLLSIAANITLVATIYTAPTLHQPMYYFLCLLALVDLLITFSISPKTLAILWFDLKTTSPAACFGQMYLIYACQGMQSSIFLFLSYDRYIAICNPLRYSSIITNRLTAKASALVLTSSTILTLPFPFLAAKLDYCAETTVPHCFCESLPVAQLSCDSHVANSLYSLAILGLFLSFNTTLMVFSYAMILRVVLGLGSSGAAHKAFSTCGSHLILIGFFYCTMIVSAISNRAEQSIPRFVHVMLTVLQYLAPPALHPLVYGIRTLEIRHAFRKLLGKVRQVYPSKDNWGIVWQEWK